MIETVVKTEEDFGTADGYSAAPSIRLKLANDNVGHLDSRSQFEVDIESLRHRPSHKFPQSHTAELGANATARLPATLRMGTLCLKFSLAFSVQFTLLEHSAEWHWKGFLLQA